MTKTLDFAYETTHEIKVGDDETTFTLVCKNEDLPVDLTAAKSITAKIGSRSGYLREQPISIDNLAKLPTGQFKFNFDKDTLDNFPTGSYFLEVWVTDAQGTSIYPSGNPLSFTVTANIENSSGASITTIAFDDFVKAMNKAASTIAKGDPGEGLDIKGQVTSVSALPATANEGDGYLVNEELYVYTSGAWKDCGTIQGPQGIQVKTGTGISSTTIQYQISNSATTAPTGTWSNDIVATTTANPYLWMKATLNYTDNTTKDFYLISQKGDKGEKGDTGTVDNTGLINAPAFQSLQSQVDNLQVGVQNLIHDTSFDQGLWHISWGNPTMSITADGNLKFTILDTAQAGVGVSAENLEMDKIYTLTAKVRGLGLFQPYIMYSDGNNFPIYDSFPMINSATKFVDIKYTFTLKGRDPMKQYAFYVLTMDAAGNWLEIKKDSLKLEAGNVPTDWCPNPSEILTQSDYAKIKAAIVALGGSLS